jgi:hypothetical protein
VVVTRVRSNATRAVGGVVALAFATSGCSLLAVDGPPPAQVRPTVDFVCTTSPAIPVADGLAAAAAGALWVYDDGKSDRDFEGRSLSRNQEKLLAVGLAATFVVSAVVGGTRVHACRDATAEKERQRLQLQRPVASPAAAPPSSSLGWNR